MALDIRQLSAAYGKVHALKNVSVTFTPGKFTALLGPNGCGKSTLLRTIMGLLPCSGGNVCLDGVLINKIPRRALAQRIAYLPQESHCPDYLTLGELIELAGYSRSSLLGGPTAEDHRLFRESLATMGLADWANRPLNALSGGQRQRAWIAMVLAQNADIILLDEPVNHLDISYQYSVLKLLTDLTVSHQKTVISVLHDLNLTAAFADEVVLMRDGEVKAKGPVDDTITTANVAEVFNFDADIYTRNDRLVCLPKNAEMVSL